MNMGVYMLCFAILGKRHKVFYFVGCVSRNVGSMLPPALSEVELSLFLVSVRIQKVLWQVLWGLNGVVRSNVAVPPWDVAWLCFCFDMAVDSFDGVLFHSFVLL